MDTNPTMELETTKNKQTNPKRITPHLSSQTEPQKIGCFCFLRLLLDFQEFPKLYNFDSETNPQESQPSPNEERNISGRSSAPPGDPCEKPGSGQEPKVGVFKPFQQYSSENWHILIPQKALESKKNPKVKPPTHQTKQQKTPMARLSAA